VYCPLGINTGQLIKDLRHAEHSAISFLIAEVTAKYFGYGLSFARGLLRAAEVSRSILGEKNTHLVSKGIRGVTGNAIPEWSPWMPKPAPPRRQDSLCSDYDEKVVYFPSCVSRLFGSSVQSPYSQSQRETLERVLKRAGFTHVYPARLDDLCCGMAFSSKGFPRQAEFKLRELFEMLWSATENGRYPALVDTSPCAQRLKLSPNRHSELRIYDVAAFLRRLVVPRVRLQKASNPVAIHVPCSLRNTSEEAELLTLAKVCAENLYVPETVPCCGFAGDRGFMHPELPASALITLKGALPVNCTRGYSTSRTCEIGLSQHSGISYQSIMYLVDDAIESVE
jgi:D-lactate dehydrogenase